MHDHSDFKILGNAVVGQKGQIVIPKEARETLGIDTGENLIVLGKGSEALLLIKSSDLGCFVEHLKKALDLFTNYDINANKKDIDSN